MKCSEFIDYLNKEPTFHEVMLLEFISAIVS
jgi:hypothetical protein